MIQEFTLDNKISDLALNSDFDDAIQFFTAIENEQEMIITRNQADFKKSKIPVMSAGEFMKSI